MPRLRRISTLEWAGRPFVSGAAQRTRGTEDVADGFVRERGLTLVPTRVYFSEPGSRAKVELALARGKDVYDKRESIRRRETAREIARELREAQR